MSNIFKLMLPGFGFKDKTPAHSAVDSLLPSPKVDTAAQPPHVGIINLSWSDTTTVPYDTVKTLYSFPHGYNKIPTVLGSFKLQVISSTNSPEGVLPLQLGALGMLGIDADEKNINLKYYSFDFGAQPMPVFTCKVHYYVMAEHGYE